jgi:glycosyltransferase involved in cell wall biosynthesis
MHGSVALSVILTTHAVRSHFEALLLTLTRINHPGIELIVINDAAESDLSASIQKVLGQTDSDQIYYFEHDSPCGRGYCLNEGLVQSSGMLIWAPLQASRLNESLLTDAIRRFKMDPAAFWSLDFSLPGSPELWIDAAEDAGLPDDTCLIWNRSVIGQNNMQFNPFLKELHGAELAMRLSENNTWHKTDPFFVLSDDQSIFAKPEDIREFTLSAIRLCSDPEEQAALFEKMQTLDKSGPSLSRDEQLLIDARKFLNIGDANKSLEFISSYLRKYPNHLEANRIKITSLEKLRRHVEAAELKHRLQKQQREEQARTQAQPVDPPETDRDPHEEAVSEPSENNSRFVYDSASGDESIPQSTAPEADQEETENELLYSVIIPTAGAGRPYLEQALVGLAEIADQQTTELIVIDNASIDDTFEYLEQLSENHFLNIRAITNQQNKGFAASINQGLDAASGKYLLVMHNDVIPGENMLSHLKDAFENQPDVGLAVPSLNNSDEPEQVAAEDESASYLTVSSADSCCFMIKKEHGFRFDEEFGLSHYEMKDFCMQVSDEGYNITVVTAARGNHTEARTSTMLGLQMVPFLKWSNKDRFYKKWGTPGENIIPEQGSHPDRLRRLGIPHDPFNPEIEWVDAVQAYLTSEVKTEILRNNWGTSDLMTILSALIIADERELLRTLEDRLDDLELPAAFLLLLIEYYFSKNIFSRCKHYLDKGGKSHPAFDLYRLKIMVADKEIKNAAPLLTSMLDKYPASPDLMQLAGDIYRLSGDQDEAKSFYALASQIDPFRFSMDESAFQIS